MSRVKIASFVRAHEYERDCVPSELPVSDCPLWLQQFAHEYAKKEGKTAVEVAKNRSNTANPSIYEQMSALVSGNVGKPKFSSVDEVVADYQQRTGLAEYLKKVKSQDVSDAAKQVLAAGESAEKKTLKNEPDGKIPDVLLKIPGIESFIRNLIETNYGIQLPAIQQTIANTFSREGVSQADADDPDLAKYINKMLGDRQQCGDVTDYTNLGRGVGTQREFDERGQNVFMSLMPARDAY